MDEDKKKVQEWLEGKKGKTKFYFSDFSKIFPDYKPRQVKKVLTALVNDGVLVFWSSGSTTMYGLAGVGKAPEGED